MSMINHEKTAETIRLNDLRDSFHGESMRQNEVKLLADRIQNRLARYFQASNLGLEAKPLDNVEFDDVYDPSLPTIVVDPDHTYSGVELLGLVSHEESTRANIVFVQTMTDGVLIRRNEDTGEGVIEVNGGAIVLPSGQVVYGKFPAVVTGDMFETADLSLIEQLEDNNVGVFSSSKAMRRFNDKGNVESLSNNPFTYTPKRISGQELLARDAVDNLVIKPSKHSQGRGVLLTDNNADAEHTKRFYQFLEDNNYEPVIEERARSWEITDPRTGERLDWNVRAILSYGELIDMYVRADKWGGPVNMSVSAHPIAMDDFPKYFKNSEDAWKVMQALHDSAQSVAAENPSSIIGIDLTVDEEGQSCLFEINNGNTGGLQTIAKLERTYDNKLFMSREVLRKFLDNTKKNDAWDGVEGTKRILLQPSFNTVAWSAWGSLYDELEKLDISEIPDNDEERYGAVLALVAIRASYRWQLTFDSDMSEEADARLREQYPLELRNHLGLIYSKSLVKSTMNEYIPYLNEHSELFRDDPGTVTLRAAFAANDFNLQRYSELYKEYTERFPNNVGGFYYATAYGFYDRFKGLTSDFDDEQQETFNINMHDAITAYCEYGYDVADQRLRRAQETSGDRNPLSNSIHALQFCVAYSAGKYNEAYRYFRAAEDDFEEPYEFHEYICQDMIPNSARELAKCSPEQRLLAIKVNMKVWGPVLALGDAIDSLRRYETDEEVRQSVINLLAEHIPAPHTDDEKARLIEVLMKGADREEIKSQESSVLPDGYKDFSEYATFTLLLEKLFDGEFKNVKILAKRMESMDNLHDGYDMLQEIFVEN